jgi:exonuclease III
MIRKALILINGGRLNLFLQVFTYYLVVNAPTYVEVRQAFKYTVMDRYMPILQENANSGRDYIICGDWNIAHKEIDLKNWKANQKNSGFLPEERAWLEPTVSVFL